MVFVFQRFAVDAYTPRESVTHYFVTHAHTDHLNGIEAIGKTRARLVCTFPTAKLVLAKWPALQRRLLVLKFQQWTQLDAEGRFRVVALDAGHCRGSAMFLFEDKDAGSCAAHTRYTKRVLHTGDCRRGALTEEEMEALGVDSVDSVDEVYADTTFVDDTLNTDTFPTDAEAARTTVDLIGTHAPVAVTTDVLGKEDWIVGVARLLGVGVKIAVTREKMNELIDAFGSELPPGVFVTERSEARIWLVPKSEATPAWCDRFRLRHEHGVVVRPYSVARSERVVRLGEFRVRQSTHCSQNELAQLLRSVKPAAVFPAYERHKDVAFIRWWKGVRGEDL